MTIPSKISDWLGRFSGAGKSVAKNLAEVIEGSGGIVGFGTTNVGVIRKNNEDNFLLRQLEDGRVVALVADGVGGQKCGEIASLTIRETIENYVNECTYNISGDAPEAWGGILTMSAHQAHRAIALRAQENEAERGMASTLTMIMANDRQGVYVQVGDSRLYKFSGGTLTQLSEDQTVANALVAAGKLSSEDVASHPGRNVLEFAMGLEASDRPLAPGSGQFEWTEGDVLLLCSDGLTDMITDNEITKLLGEKGGLEKRVQLLISAALEAGGRDNITVCLLENIGSARG